MRAFRGVEEMTLGEETFTLAIDIEIIDELEDAFDVSFDQILQISAGKGRLGKTTRLLRGLLARHHPDLGLDEIGSMIVGYGTEVGEAINRLMEKATPEAEAKDANPPTAHRGTGASSSSRGARQTSRQTNSGSKRPVPCS